MRAIDFEYDGQYLSSYGFIICDFNFSNGATEATAGAAITFNKVSRHQGKAYSLSSTQYNECITTTFDICKNPDVFDLEDREISPDEHTNIMRWLNRREFFRMCFIGDDEYDQKVVYYNASFNITKIKIGEKLYGLRIAMETDRPFGYGQEQKTILDFSQSTAPKIINDISDDIGSIYPTVIIECRSSGNLSIRNTLEGCYTVIKNCSDGEVITLYGDTHIIKSSLNSHDICDDFNYDFFRIGNTINNRSNVVMVSLPCILTVKYSPIIKDTP